MDARTLYVATLTATSDGFIASWTKDGLSEVHQAADLMQALEFLRERVWSV
ncbi:MAG: hypothetical protein H0W40_19425 [Methylibium sp.]|uniref:hypothetical protein n=1 Tax=Methylibium sp. TaxID=2067992 RepID=UPI001819611E|nr:hypothetical protein [Methylibium sp.]MBA3599515.1 hypothetical protein [Methylibium sp.]